MSLHGKRQVRFIHGADVHLGAPFRGLRELSEAWADRLVEAVPEAFDRLVDTAVRERVDFVVLAGDIFDNGRPSYRDYLRFFQGIERLSDAGIPTYLITGNHDPYVSWQQDLFAFPEHGHMLSADRPDFRLFERDGEPLVIIAGRGYPNKVWSRDRDIAEGLNRAAAEAALGPRAQQAPFGVGVLHTGLDQDLVKAPTDPRGLLRSGLDYWALGHVHRRYLDDERDPHIGFSGCIQGRDIKEVGARGVHLVTLTEDAPAQVRFVPTASVVWQRLSIDVGECATPSDIIQLVMRELFRVNGDARCEEMICRITLTGATALHETLGRADVIEGMREALNNSYPDFFVDALIDRTTLPLDKEALRREGLFPAVFMATAENARRDGTAQYAYLQDEFMAKNVAMPVLAQQQVDALAQEAEDMVLDLLIGEAGEGA